MALETKYAKQNYFKEQLTKLEQGANDELMLDNVPAHWGEKEIRWWIAWRADRITPPYRKSDPEFKQFIQECKELGI